MTVITKDQRQTLQRRITTLLDIIGRETTKATERAAAEHMLHKLRAKLTDLDVDLFQDGWNTTASGQTYYQLPERWYGSKCERNGYVPLTEINKLLRAEIKDLRLLGKKLSKIAGTVLATTDADLTDAIAEMPDFIKVSVRKRDSGIYITLKGVPADWWVDGETYYGAPIRKPVRELQKLIDALYDLMAQYRYDGSDPQVDYFDTNFYPHVESDGHGDAQWPYPRSVNRSRGY